MSLEEFFPVYPEIKDEKFEDKLFKKMEFIELIPDEENAKKGDVKLPNKLYLHQELTKRYLEPFTGYKRVLLDHEVGVGKTRSVIAVCENYLDNYNAKRVFFFSKNKNVQENFKTELFQNMQIEKYIQKEEAEYARMAQKGLKISRTRSIEKYYTFETFEVFARVKIIQDVERVQSKISEIMSNGKISDEEAAKKLDKLDYYERMNLMIQNVMEEDEITREEVIENLDQEERDEYLSFLSELEEVKKDFKMTEEEAENMLELDDKGYLETIRNEYKNTVIAIDEVHNMGVVSFSPLDKKDVDDSHYQYRRFWCFLQSLKDVHVILLSATPMVDNAVKIASIMNLILPRDNQISYSELKKRVKAMDQKSISEYLCPFFKGKISFLKQSSGVAKQNFMGEVVTFDKKKGISSKVFQDYMEPTQILAYTNVKTRKAESEFHHDLRQVSNFAILELEDEEYKHSKKKESKKRETFKDEDEIVDEFEIEDIDVQVEKTDQKFRYITQSDFATLLNDKRTYFINRQYEKFYSNVEEMEDFKKFIQIKDLKEHQKLFFVKQFFKKATESDYKNYISKLDKETKRFNELRENRLLMSVMRPDLATKNIRKSGVKIANIIYDILDNLTLPEEDQRCIFIYSHYKIYGAILIAVLLKLLGFEKYKPESNEARSPPPSSFDGIPFRFATITEAKDPVLQIVQDFNKKSNRFGHILKVVIGSPQSSESISFLNVRTIHILEPGWNDQDTIQAIGRGVRSNSHAFFAPEKRFVDIFIHAAVIKNNEKKMIDMKAIEISAMKAYKINLVQNTAKECSYDKDFNRWRNDLPLRPIQEIDFSTYRVYYDKKFMEFMLKKIQPLFFTKSSFTLKELSLETGFTEEDFIIALDNLSEYTLQNHLGIQCYPHYDGKNLFLLPFRVSKTDFLDYYSDTINITMNTSTNLFIKNSKLYEEIIKENFVKLNQKPADKVIQYLRKRDKNNVKIVPYGIEIYMLEQILEKPISQRTENEKVMADYMKWRWFVIEHDNKKKLVHTLQYISETHHFNCAKHHFEQDGLLRVLDEKGWRYATKEEEDAILPEINITLKNEFEQYDQNIYYGILCTTDGGFRLIDKRKSKMTRPKDCRQHKRGVAFYNIGKKCIIFDLYQIWDELLDALPEYSNIPSQSYNAFEDYFLRNYNSKNKLTLLFEKYFTKKGLIWVY